ncbi:hypothetical protein Lal_00032545 [Lupinus albus]|nr:hypothetical protein Lal_00032545 [Lupinus albus]
MEHYSNSWKPRLIERFSPERKMISWEEKRERRAFQEQGALGLILELEKRVNMNVGNEDVKDKSNIHAIRYIGKEYFRKCYLRVFNEGDDCM